MVMGRLRDIGLLTLRVGIGGTLAAHGTQKLFGWFGGPGLDGTAAFFETTGFRPGRTNALLAGATEAGSGLLLAAGLATPAAAAAAAGTMVVASASHAENGFFAQKGGYEYSAILALAGVSLALIGPGRCSLDHATRHAFDRPWMRVVAALTVIPAAKAMLMRQRAALAETAAAAEQEG